MLNKLKYISILTVAFLYLPVIFIQGASQSASVSIVTDLIDIESSLSKLGIGEVTYDDLSILDWGMESGQISFRGDGRMILDNGVRTNFTLSGTQGYINIFEDSDHDGIYDYFELGKNFSVDTDAQIAISYNSIYDAYGNYLGRGSVGFEGNLFNS